jgi:hypothetical protein
MQKVVIGIPSHSGTLNSECVLSLLAAQQLLFMKDIKCEVIILNGCAYLPVARNTLVAMFMKDIDATDLFFIDADVGFDASAVLKLLGRQEDIVAGIYPLKKDVEGYPVEIKRVDGVPVGQDDLVEADFLPTGFMRIKRKVFDAMQEAYPELKYKSGIVDVSNSDVKEVYDFFNMGAIGSSAWTTEDFAFCQRWRDVGGQLWIMPDIDFTHTGNKAFTGNFHQYLLQGGKEIV